MTAIISICKILTLGFIGYLFLDTGHYILSFITVLIVSNESYTITRTVKK